MSVERINALKAGIEAKTGGSYATLTEGVQALADGYGVGSAPVLTDLEITENGEYTPPDGVDGFDKVTVNVAGSESDVVRYEYFNSLSVEPTVTKNVVIDATYAKSVMCSGLQQYKQVIVTAPHKVSLNLSQAFRTTSAGTHVLESIHLENIVATNLYYAFANNDNHKSVLHTITGIDASGCGGGNHHLSRLFDCRYNKLTHIEFVPNTIGKKDLASYSGNTLELGGYNVNMNIVDTESFISIANGLCADNVSTISSNGKFAVRANTICGTIIKQTDEDGEYDFFVADDSGTVTLTEFITVTKGWTLT